MEVMNILEIKTYELIDEEKIMIIKNWQAGGLAMHKTFTNKEKEKCQTVKALFLH